MMHGRWTRSVHDDRPSHRCQGARVTGNACARARRADCPARCRPCSVAGCSVGAARGPEDCRLSSVIASARDLGAAERQFWLAAWVHRDHHAEVWHVRVLSFHMVHPRRAGRLHGPGGLCGPAMAWNALTTSYDRYGAKSPYADSADSADSGGAIRLHGQRRNGGRGTLVWGAAVGNTESTLRGGGGRPGRQPRQTRHRRSPAGLSADIRTSAVYDISIGLRRSLWW